MYKLLITDNYQKKAKKFFKKNPELITHYEKILILLCENPYHPSLRTHKLSGKLKGIFSISINLSYRLLINFIIKDNIIVPIEIGSHDQVY